MNLTEKYLLELQRKSIHISSIFIPLFYRYIIFYNRKLMVLILAVMTVFIIFIEILRLENFTFRKMFNKLFGQLMRTHEITHFSGATFLMLSSLISIAFFSRDIAFSAIAFLSVGDTMAAIIGTNFGKRKFIGSQKSLEGSLACFLSTFTFALIFGLPPLLAFVGSVAASVAEFSDIPLDDNIKIPLFSGFIMTLTKLFI